MAVAPLQPRVSAADVPPERLAANKTLTEQQKVAEASRQFEAILLREILDASQKTVIQSKFSDNSTAGSIYRDMITNQLADAISKSGAFGLASVFEKQLTRPDASPSAEGADKPAASHTTGTKETRTPHAPKPGAAGGVQLGLNHPQLSRHHP